MVDHANRLLGDRHAAIGPSHFLREDLTERWVGLIWARSTGPSTRPALTISKGWLAGPLSEVIIEERGRR